MPVYKDEMDVIDRISNAYFDAFCFYEDVDRRIWAIIIWEQLVEAE